MGNVCRITTAATTIMTAEIIAMKPDVCSEPVTQTLNLPVIMAGVFPAHIFAMESTTAMTTAHLMRGIVVSHPHSAFVTEIYAVFIYYVLFITYCIDILVKH